MEGQAPWMRNKKKDADSPPVAAAATTAPAPAPVIAAAATEQGNTVDGWKVEDTLREGSWLPTLVSTYQSL
jgi:hypothetical protein